MSKKLVKENKFDPDLDTVMIPILKRLWKYNIETVFSCAGHKGDWLTAYLVYKKNDRFSRYLMNNGYDIWESTDGKCAVYCFNGGRNDEPIKLHIRKQSKKMRDKFIKTLKKYHPLAEGIAA